MSIVTVADDPIPGLQAGEARAVAGPAERFVRAITPDLRLNPRAALRDMRLTEPLRSALAKIAAGAGLSLEEGRADDEYADSEGNVLHRQFSVLRSASEEVVLLQIPDWIANDGANVGALTEIRDALTNRKVRIVAPNVYTPDFSLDETMPKIWLKKASIDLKFVSWRYVEELQQGKRSASTLFGLATTPTPAGAPPAVTAVITKVFISSTGKDLHAYREAARDICLDLQLFPLMMEHFEAMGVGATAGSKKKLDQANLYVGIFAHRYGYIEQGHGKSVTQIEFEHAGQRALERLCFVIDPKYPWPQDAADPEHHTQMSSFKQQIAMLIRAEFTTVDDFKVKLQKALIPHRR